MINWSEINSLQKQKLDLQIKLNELINSDSKSIDKINELKAEILYLDKQISTILGSNELKRVEELKNKKSGIEQRNKNAYFALKNKYKKISKMKTATERMMNLIDTLNNEKEEQVGKVKVM